MGDGDNATQRDEGEAPPKSLPFESGPDDVSRIGRFQLLKKVGQGGMGLVFSAYDDELDRRIAIKLIRSDKEEGYASRMRREAQALAKLSHPNVVAVYDVGNHGGHLFIAMEYVKGQTLREWAKDAAPAWPAIVDVYGQAAAGLAAAHAAGLVHRDFKPDNAILAKDGRVRVLDFGLVRRGDERDAVAVDGVQPTELPSPRRADLDTPMTDHGAMMGTPAYMAPEQFLGEDVGVESDQFALCVAMYEALFGERPFAGTDRKTLATNVTRGKLKPLPKGHGVPAWLHKLVVRGLSPDPTERWASVDALRAELRRRTATKKTAWLGLGLAGGLGAVGLGLWQYARVDRRCDGARTQLEGVWDDARSQEVEDAILGTELPYAVDTWTRLQPALDAYADAWVAEHTEACEATSVRGEQSQAHMDLRMGCLRGRRRRLLATVDELAQADTTVVENAVLAVAGLPRLSRCADLDALSAEVPPPDDPAVARKVEALDERLATATAKRDAGKYDEGVEVAQAVATEASTLGYEPLTARALLRLGGLHGAAGDFDASEKTLKRAYHAAVAQRMAAEAADASTQLVSLFARHLARPRDAERWAEHAVPLSRAAKTDHARARVLSSLGDLHEVKGEYDAARDSREQALAIHELTAGQVNPEVARALSALGVGARIEGRYDDSVEFHRRALAMRREIFGARHPAVAGSMYSLATVLVDQGKGNEARDLLEQALVIQEHALGPEHQTVAVSLNSLGSLAHSRGDLDNARRLLARALTIREKGMGPGHPGVAIVLSNLGGIARAEGKPEEAASLYRRALAITREALGQDHPDVAVLLNNLGAVANSRGRWEEARGYLQEALVLKEDAVGPEHPDIAVLLLNLGLAASAKGDHQDAHDTFARALGIAEAGLGPKHPIVAATLNAVGRELIELSRPVEALRHLERALAFGQVAGAMPNETANTKFELARALWLAPADAGRDRPRARSLAEQARDSFSALGPAFSYELDEVQQWLAAHGPP